MGIFHIFMLISRQSNLYFPNVFRFRDTSSRAAALAKRMALTRHQGFIIARVLAKYLMNPYPSAPKGLPGLVSG